MYWLLAVPVFIIAIAAVLVPNALSQPAFAQEVITVNQTDPCFLNYTAGMQMVENCGFGEDYLQSAMLPWQWVTGGYFGAILVSILVLFSYIKYHKAVYPLFVGMLFLPIAYYLFPHDWLNIAFILVGLLLCILMWHIFIRQSKDYSG